jgi:D-alanyl-D-alanine carboxypeptidase
MRPSDSKFLYSILTAILIGIVAAYICIGAVELFRKPELMASALNSVTATAKSIQFNSLLSKHLNYDAEAEEDASDDITFTGENLTAPKVDSSGAAISALAYSVQSLDKENILVEKDAERLLPIASVTKLITAVMATKLFKPDDVIEINSSVLATEGATGNFRLGERFKVKEILYPLLMVSSNDAAEAISQAYDKRFGKGKFVQKMNSWVGEIGAYRTYFKDASGLSPQNVSTARDLSIIAKWIKDNEPQIFDITLAKSKTIRTHTWLNPTHFLSLSSYTGGKNGYIPEARLTNVSLFALGTPKRYYSVVLLGSQSRDKDTLSVLNKAVK